MGAFHIAFDIVAWIGAFVVVHYLTAWFLKDPTNIEYWTSILIVFIPSYVLFYGLPSGGAFSYGAPLGDALLTIRETLVIGIATLVAWGLASVFTILVWWEDLMIGIASVASYIILYSGVQWIWNHIFPM